MRFLFYSHDGFGLGHTCRNLAIARALTELAPRASVLLATGSDDVTRLGVPDRVEILKLPSLRKMGNDSYSSRHLGVSSEDLRLLRSRLLAGTTEWFTPDVLLVDKHPFGAGGELKDALAVIRRLGGRAVLGLRDILDAPDTVRQEWRTHNLPEAIPAHYDSVLVYGQEKVFDSATAYDFPEELRARTHYSGYVINPAGAGNVTAHPPIADPNRPLVLATVGGGEDGFHLLKNFLLASRGAPWRAIAVTGTMMPDPEHSELEQLAHECAIPLHTFVPGLNHWFASASAVVCMGGYNTLAQTLAAAVPVVCVPRVQPRQEQLVRAEAFSRLKLLQLIAPDTLAPGTLRHEISRAIATPRRLLRSRIQSTVELEGAEFAAHHLLAMARTSRIQNRQQTEPLKVIE